MWHLSTLQTGLKRRDLINCCPFWAWWFSQMANVVAFLFSIKWSDNIWGISYHLGKAPKSSPASDRVTGMLQVACFDMKHKYCSADSYKNAKANSALNRITLTESCILLILTSWTRQNYGPLNSSNMNSLTACHKQIPRLVFNCIFWFLSDRFPYYTYMGSYHLYDNNVHSQT